MASIPNPNDFTDPEELRGLAANARRLGHDDLALRCMVRIAELSGHNYDDDLERAFWRAISMAEELKFLEHGKNVKLSRTRQKYDRQGSRACIVDLATKSTFSDGFHILNDAGHLELTFEAILLQNAAHFTPNEVAAVKAKLRSAGVTDTEITSWHHD